MGKWLIFVEKKRLAKTGVWDIFNKESGVHLGEIRWNPAWRQYWSLPDAGTGWAKSCHREVADFIEQKMDERKGKKRPMPMYVKDSRLCVEKICEILEKQEKNR